MAVAVSAQSISTKCFPSPHQQSGYFLMNVMGMPHVTQIQYENILQDYMIII